MSPPPLSPSSITTLQTMSLPSVSHFFDHSLCAKNLGGAVLDLKKKKGNINDCDLVGISVLPEKTS